MDPGTALAAVSLALQLAGTVQTVNEFLCTIRNAPSELVTLIETMDLMQSNLNQVQSLVEQQFSDSSLGGSPVFILNALKLCERRVEVQRIWVVSVLISQDANSIGNYVDCQMMIGLSQRWASKPYGRSSKAVWAIGRTPALGNAPYT